MQVGTVDRRRHGARSRQGFGADAILSVGFGDIFGERVWLRDCLRVGAVLIDFVYASHSR